MQLSFKWDEKPLVTAANQKFYNNMQKAVIVVERDARRLAPIDTGRLQNSITHTITRSGKDIVGIVGTNVNYAVPVEYGTSRQSAQPYLRPALNNNLQTIRQLFKG